MSAERIKESSWIIDDLYDALFKIEKRLISEDASLTKKSLELERQNIAREIRERLKKEVGWELEAYYRYRSDAINDVLIKECQDCQAELNRRLLFCENPRERLKLRSQLDDIISYIKEFQAELDELIKTLKKIAELSKRGFEENGPLVNELELKFDRQKYFVWKAFLACKRQENDANNQEPLLTYLLKYEEYQTAELRRLEGAIREARNLETAPEVMVSLASLKKFFWSCLQEDQDCLISECKSYIGIDPVDLFEIQSVELKAEELIKRCRQSKAVLYNLLHYSYSKGKELRDFTVAIA